jgi:hypothetical protein
VAFGVDGPEDVAFQYMLDGSAAIIGDVEYIGQSLNNLTLLVDPATGESRLENTSTFAAQMDAYTVTSDSGALLYQDGEWSSLDDQDAAGGDWFEANVDANRITEFKVDGFAMLEPGTTFGLGTLFDTAAEQDLAFQFLLAGENVMRPGIVLYKSLSVMIDLPGDYNDDGLVSAADYVVWRNASGQSIELPNDTTPGSVEHEDYIVWRENFGAGGFDSAGGTSVPEPATVLSLLSVAVATALGIRSRQRSQRERQRFPGIGGAGAL